MVDLNVVIPAAGGLACVTLTLMTYRAKLRSQENLRATLSALETVRHSHERLFRGWETLEDDDVALEFTKAQLERIVNGSITLNQTQSRRLAQEMLNGKGRMTQEDLALAVRMVELLQFRGGVHISSESLAQMRALVEKIAAMSTGEFMPTNAPTPEGRRIRE